MDVLQIKGGIKITGIGDFNLVHIFECGQAFRWEADGDGYTGVAGGKVVRARFKEGSLILENATVKDYSSFWRQYFDLDRDYALIKRELSKDPVMAEAIRHGGGIRILNQDLWETLVSFIISANNNISRIKLTIKELSQRYGKKILWNGRHFYTFPSADIISRVSQKELKSCGCGYRADYIKKTARKVADGEIDFGQLKNLSYREARDILLRCPGVGPKVADCVLLFSLGKYEAFPVDVWIRRAVGHLYFHREVSAKEIRKFAKEKFGSLAGFAQQYLFYYARGKIR